jgi:MYXO-CTERM domain-containing protein
MVGMFGMFGWFGRGCVLLATVAAVAGTSRPVQACSPPLESGLYLQIVDGPIPAVPIDGVIAFAADAYGPLDVALALLGVEVTLDGVVIEGALETVALADYPGDYESHYMMVLWRPAAPFEPSAQYVATVSVASEFDGPPSVVVLDVPSAQGPAGALPVPELATAELTAVEVEAGRYVCCETESGNGGCGFPECRGGSMDDWPNLTAVISTGSDPVLSQTYLRVRAGVGGETEPVANLVLDPSYDDFQLGNLFTAPADSYCLGVELVSLIDGSATAVVELCADHGELELGSRDNPGFEMLVETCEAPYWQDDGSPYVPDGGSDDAGTDDSGGDEAPGTDDDGGSDDDATAEDDGGTDSGGQDDESKGCGCDVDGQRSLLPGLLALGIGLGLRRRRR